MKKIKKALLLTSLFALTGCDFDSLLGLFKHDSETTQKEKNNQNNNQEDINNEENNNEEEKIEFAEWPTKSIQDLVIEVSGSSALIPEYNEATKIEINTDSLVLEGYFGIFCYTSDEKSEDKYLDILKKANWEVELEKDEQGFYAAYDENYEVCMNFGYFKEFADLEIYVTNSYKTKWPESTVAEALQEIMPGTTTIIPEFEAYTVIATYYPLYEALAINGYSFENTIIEDYKTTLTNQGWTVSFNDNSSEWNATSPNKDIEIHFYIDENKNEFNVDVLKHVELVEGWPLGGISSLISALGATGTVPMYMGGKQTSFGIMDDIFGVGIIINLKENINGSDEAVSYIEMIKGQGYVDVGTDGVDRFYAYPGTTLGITAYCGLPGSFTIALCNVNDLEK